MADPFFAVALIAELARAAVVGLVAMFLWRIGDYLWRVQEHLETITERLKWLEREDGK